MSEELNKTYKQYKAGKFKIEMNEIYQVGFLLASRLGHEQIYAVDWLDRAEMDFGEVEKWLQENQPVIRVF